MKKTFTLISALLISTSASAQMGLPLPNQFTSLPGLDALGLDSLSSSGTSLGAGSGLTAPPDVGDIASLIESDPLGIMAQAIEFQGMGAPLLTPILLQVAPMLDAGQASPVLVPLLGAGFPIPGLPNLDILM